MLLSCLVCRPLAAAPGYERSINDVWTFHKDGSDVMETVSFPHTWNAVDSVDDEPGYWKGTGWYEKTIFVEDDLSGKKVFVRFEGFSFTGDENVGESEN